MTVCVRRVGEQETATNTNASNVNRTLPNEPCPSNQGAGAESGSVIAVAREECERSIAALLLRQATRLLGRAIHAELDEFLRRSADSGSHTAVVRNGYQPARALVTSLGPVMIRVPKVRARGANPAVFRSMLARPYLRRTRTSTRQAPARFLLALAKGDLHAAITVLMGPEAAALPPRVMGRLLLQWNAEHGRWLTGSLADLPCAAVWLASLHCVEEQPEAPALMAIGVDVSAQERILAVAHGIHPSVPSWTTLLCDLRRRGLAFPRRFQAEDRIHQMVRQAVVRAFPEITQQSVPEESG
jgi:hypothetical protein